MSLIGLRLATTRPLRCVGFGCCLVSALKELVLDSSKHRPSPVSAIVESTVREIIVIIWELILAVANLHLALGGRNRAYHPLLMRRYQVIHETKCSAEQSAAE